MVSDKSKPVMRLQVRFIVPLILGVAIVSVLFAVYQVHKEDRRLRRELERRSEVLAESLRENAESALETHSPANLRRIVERVARRERLVGMTVYDDQGNALAESPHMERLAGLRSGAAATAARTNSAYSAFVERDGASLYVYAIPLHGDQNVAGSAVILQDAGFIAADVRRLWRDTLVHALIQTLLITVTSLLLIRWTLTNPVARVAHWARSLRLGGASSSPPPEGAGLEPLTHEMTHLAQSLDAARAAAEEEARLREAAESMWTAERLRVSVRAKLQDSALFVIANREPYMHVREQGGVKLIVPASGVVTALEPVLLACEGTWIAHGSGDADREVVDQHDRLRVPPDNPRYTLRRVWLTPEEENGYYYGFSNEGLWPLCHIAHTRPVFRPADWSDYVQVNQKFAGGALEEIGGKESPIVLVQDYHFALLPRLIKEQRPNARVAIFWHIPWPNPEAFRICPWQGELLDGLLGADLIGFHIQAHCNNFLETVDRALEARTDWDHFAVTRHDHRTLVRPFPISVAYSNGTSNGDAANERTAIRQRILNELKLDVQFLGVGVDRLDYTKGILERFWSIERFLGEYSAYFGQFSFVQIGAPSRTNIKGYQDLIRQIEQEAARINEKFSTGSWKPIVLLKRHHDHAEIDQFYRAADLCMVTSLHDGMNLVAKEFVAARDDEQGVLILSGFTGASRELTDALVVNPYDVTQVAAAIAAALEMKPEEQMERMQRMRKVVKENNVYRWAGNLLSALADIRIESTESVGSQS